MERVEIVTMNLGLVISEFSIQEIQCKGIDSKEVSESNGLIERGSLEVSEVDCGFIFLKFSKYWRVAF